MENAPSTEEVQNLQQSEIWQGSRGPVEISEMVVTYAVRALDKLVRNHSHSVLTTPLGQALIARASLEGSTATGVDAIQGDLRMLRGADGKFVGGYVPRESR